MEDFGGYYLDGPLEGITSLEIFRSLRRGLKLLYDQGPEPWITLGQCLAATMQAPWEHEMVEDHITHQEVLVYVVLSLSTTSTS